jgi:hypothetical protein
MRISRCRPQRAPLASVALSTVDCADSAITAVSESFCTESKCSNASTSARSSAVAPACEFFLVLGEREIRNGMEQALDFPVHFLVAGMSGISVKRISVSAENSLNGS